MEKLQSHHHNTILAGIVVAAVVLGVGFGTMISEATSGTQGMLIIIFALSLVNIIISLLLFTQTVGRK